MKSLLNKIYTNQTDEDLLEKLLNVAESHKTNKSVDKPEHWGTSTGDSHARYKDQKHNYGTLGNTKVENEFSKTKNKTPKEEEIKFEIYESQNYRNDDKKDFDTNILQNFESFSQQKDEDIYGQFAMSHKLGGRNYMPVTNDQGYDFASEKIIPHKVETDKKKLLNSSIYKLNPKDPYLRYSVNDPNKIEVKPVPKYKKSLLANKRGTIEPNPGHIYKDTSNYMKKENKLEMTIVDLADERIDIKDFETNEQFESFAQLDKTPNNAVSRFSSFSNNDTNVKKEAPSLIDSFGAEPNEVILELLSNWGSPFQIGLTEVKLYDPDMNEIKIDLDNFKLYNNNIEHKTDQIVNVVNDKVATTNPAHMLLLDYNKYKDNYTLCFKSYMEIDIGFIVIWNLNEDPCKGVQKLRITLGSRKVYEGEVLQATGKLTNYSRFLVAKVNSDLEEDILIEQINKKFINERLRGPALTSNLPLINSGKQRTYDFKEPETPVFDHSTPKNKLKTKTDILDKAKTPNLAKKSTQYLEKFESIKFPSNPSIESKNKLKSFNTLEAGSDIKPFKAHYAKLEPIAVNRKKNAFESCQTLTDLTSLSNDSRMPTLPLVDGITCKLISNWGDKTAIGLNGIEIFNDKGDKLILTHRHIALKSKTGKTFPKQLNEERIVGDSLITKDENKHWSYPINGNLPLVLKLKFDSPQHISLIRIWNYNCSRIHAAKGVKDIMITNYEDTNLLFAGRIRKASGFLTRPRKNFEALTFTMEKSVLAEIARNDWLYAYMSQKSSTVVKRKIKNCFDEFINQRPTTTEMEELQSSRQKARISKIREHAGNQSGELRQRLAFQSNTVLDIHGVIGCKTLKLAVLETWGHLSEFGLLGIEFYTAKDQKISEEYYTISTKSMSIYDEHVDIDGDLKLKRPVLLRFNPNEDNIIEFTFKSFVQISYLCIYNIGEASKKGTKAIKRVALYADNNMLTSDRGIYIKKGSNLKFMKRYPQKITFPISQLVYNIEPKPSALMPISSPTGFTLEFHLKCTFGDPYYIGLNSIEIFDIMGNNLLVKENEANFRIIADPPGVFILPEMNRDPRVVSNLCKPNPFADGVSDVWLAPFAKYDRKYNRNIVAVEFKNPVTIGVINIWNYSRTINRGVKEVEVYLDDNMVYCGWLNDIKEKLISSIIFSEVFLKKRVEHVQLEPIAHLPKDITELNNEGNVLKKRTSDKYLDVMRPATGLYLE